MPSLSNSAKELWPRKVRAEFLSDERLFLSSCLPGKEKNSHHNALTKIASRSGCFLFQSVDSKIVQK